MKTNAAPNAISVKPIKWYSIHGGYTIEGARRRLRMSDKRANELPARTRAVLERVRKEAEELLRLVED